MMSCWWWNGLAWSFEGVVVAQRTDQQYLPCWCWFQEACCVQTTDFGWLERISQCLLSLDLQNQLCVPDQSYDYSWTQWSSILFACARWLSCTSLPEERRLSESLTCVQGLPPLFRFDWWEFHLDHLIHSVLGCEKSFVWICVEPHRTRLLRQPLGLTRPKLRLLASLFSSYGLFVIWHMHSLLMLQPLHYLHQAF